MTKRQWWQAVAMVLWVVFGFVVAYFIVRAVVEVLKYVGLPFQEINPSVFSTVTAASVYGVALLMVIGLPRWLKKYPTTKSDIGLSRLPNWLDLGLGPAGFVVYLFASSILIYAATKLIPGFDPNEVQDVGFAHLNHYFEMLLAFATLVIVVPFAEEVLFRGYLYGRLRKMVPLWVAITVTSVLFGLVHGHWNVAIDVFTLSVVMCGLREMTGSIWSGIILHMIKNSLAFYLTFINPAILHTMGVQ